MVESSRAKINFIKLTPEVLSSKIALLVSNHERVVFWKRSPKYFEGRAISFKFSGKISLRINYSDISRSVEGEVVCLNFSLNEIEYFLRGKVVEQSELEKELEIDLEAHCFRVEKRSKERLLAYPVYDIYAYLKFKKSPKPNVIYFNKNEQKNRDFFSEIDNLQKNKIAAMSASLEKNDEEDLVGFRVEDISSSGLSFFASSKEKEIILDELENSQFTLVLNFEMQVFTLEEAVVVYKMNYINTQFSGVPMFKVGINFKQNVALKKKIEETSGITIDLGNYQKDFEEFIKNE